MNVSNILTLLVILATALTPFVSAAGYRVDDYGGGVYGGDVYEAHYAQPAYGGKQVVMAPQHGAFSTGSWGEGFGALIMFIIGIVIIIFVIFIICVLFSVSVWGLERVTGMNACCGKVVSTPCIQPCAKKCDKGCHHHRKSKVC